MLLLELDTVRAEKSGENSQSRQETVAIHNKLPGNMLLADIPSSSFYTTTLGAFSRSFVELIKTFYAMQPVGILKTVRHFRHLFYHF